MQHRQYLAVLFHFKIIGPLLNNLTETYQRGRIPDQGVHPKFLIKIHYFFVMCQKCSTKDFTSIEFLQTNFEEKNLWF